MTEAYDLGDTTSVRKSKINKYRYILSAHFHKLCNIEYILHKFSIKTVSYLDCFSCANSGRDVRRV